MKLKVSFWIRCQKNMSNMVCSLEHVPWSDLRRKVAKGAFRRHWWLNVMMERLFIQCRNIVAANLVAGIKNPGRKLFFLAVIVVQLHTGWGVLSAEGHFILL